jgi:hypothetical protein
MARLYLDRANFLAILDVVYYVTRRLIYDINEYTQELHLLILRSVDASPGISLQKELVLLTQFPLSNARN